MLSMLKAIVPQSELVLLCRQKWSNSTFSRWARSATECIPVMANLRILPAGAELACTEDETAGSRGTPHLYHHVSRNTPLITVALNVKVILLVPAHLVPDVAFPSLTLVLDVEEHTAQVGLREAIPVCTRPNVVCVNWTKHAAI
jgi:hypothetical protein